MKQTKYFTMLLTILYIFYYTTGYSAQERQIKNLGDWPFVQIENDNHIHLIFTNNINYGTLGYLQYDPIADSVINPISVLDTNQYYSSYPQIGLSNRFVLVSFMIDAAPISCYTLSTQAIRLDDLDTSPTKLLRQQEAEWFQSVGNIAIEDTIFGLFWIGSRGLYGQYVSASLQTTSAEFLISDSLSSEYYYGSGGIDYSPVNRHFISVWSDNHTGYFRLYGRIFNYDRSVWGPTLTLTDTLTTNILWHPKVLWNSDTTFTVFYWTDANNLERQTYNSHGVSLDFQEQVNTNANGIDDFAVARDSLGRMVAVWEDLTTGKILCQRFNTDASLLGSNIVISTGTYQVPTWSLTVDFKNGLVCVVWNDADYRLWLQVFDFDNPEKIGPEKSPTAPQDFRLIGNYPNPFNATTKIRFYLSQMGPVELKVWDCRGALVWEREYHGRASGWNEIEFEANDLPSGLYLYEVRSGKNASRAKMLLMK